MKRLFKILFELFDPKELRQTLVLVFLMFIGVFLEVLSIGMFFPILTFMMQDNYAAYLTEISIFKNYLNDLDQKQIGFLLLIILFFIFLIKNLYLAYLSNYQMKYIFGIQQNLSSKIFSKYVYNEYSFFVSSNSYQLIQNIIGEINVFTQSFLMPFLTLILELLVIFFLFITIILVQPLSAIIIITIFVSFSLFIYFILKAKLFTLGKIRQENEYLVIKTLQNSFLGIKDIKIFGAEKKFINNYNIYNTKASNAVRDQLTIQSFPRLALEFLTVTSFIIVTFFLLYKTASFKLLLSTIGFFAAAAFRIMPSINRINIAIQSIKYSKSAIRMLSEEIDNINSQHFLKKETIENFNNVIEINNISVQYLNPKKTILDDVSLRISKGMKIGIMGESGSGKTTFLDSILGLIKFNSGSIKIDNLEFKNNNFSLKNIVGYIPQDVFLLNSTLEENIIFGSSKKEIDYVNLKKSIEVSQLLNFINDLPDGLKTRIGDRGINISGGQRQRLGIARAIYKNPAILVLDEATSALDLDTETRIMELIYNLDKNITIIIVTHRPSTVSKCDEVYIIKNKKLKLQ